MLDYWLYLLLLLYSAALLFSLRRQRGVFTEEVKFFAWYLLTGLVAALFARKWDDMEELLECGDCGLYMGLLPSIYYRTDWRNYIAPYLMAFALLGLLRHLILMIVIWKRGRSPAASARR